MDKTTQKGIAFLAMAIFAFTAMDAIAKHLVAIYPTAQVVWARNIGQLVFVLLYLNRRLPEAVKTRLPGLHVARSLTQLGATGFFFYSLNHIGLAEATALANINPVLITVGAALFLGETLTRARVLGLGVAMLGALIVLRPGMGVFTAAAVLPIICAFSYAANMLLTRAVGSRESPWAAMFYSALFGTIVTTALLPFGWREMTAQDVGLFAAVGLLGATAQLLMIRAYSLTQASVLAPFGYLDMVFAIFWSVTVFDQWPDLYTLGGALVIACAGIYVWRREQGA
ncbi:DMT family transporter [Stagnihabitans tardus]|uniref:EamA family transporter n=1 Tax=Stagnihabitans tardus TaxID=2699202 RepID=A0AAE5BUI9_9RHOB|nr:DMT family transporter [Stagnihabitans tardus]NBZ87966.1 EamA family transporter [Stagnihabitans tardus]